MRETIPGKNTHKGLPEGNQAILTPSAVTLTESNSTLRKEIICTGESLLFSKPQLAEVPEHQVPVIAQLLSGPGQNEPIVEIVDDSDAHFP